MKQDTSKMMEEIDKVMKNYPDYRWIIVHKDMKAIDLLMKR